MSSGRTRSRSMTPRCISRLLLGTARYPSPAILAQAIRASQTQIVTVSLRREAGGSRAGESFWELVRESGARVLPNTAGCRTAQGGRDHGANGARDFRHRLDQARGHRRRGHAAARCSSAWSRRRASSRREGFRVFPYMTEDLVVAEKLLEAGCRVLMPWAAPIGSGRGINNLFGLRALRARFPGCPADRRRGAWRALARRGGDGAGL